jgi:hypothetical protein
MLVDGNESTPTAVPPSVLVGVLLAFGVDPGYMLQIPGWRLIYDDQS